LIRSRSLRDSTSIFGSSIGLFEMSLQASNAVGGRLGGGHES
jgi:hypothetical protein